MFLRNPRLLVVLAAIQSESKGQGSLDTLLDLDPCEAALAVGTAQSEGFATRDRIPQLTNAGHRWVTEELAKLAPLFTAGTVKLDLAAQAGARRFMVI